MQKLTIDLEGRLRLGKREVKAIQLGAPKIVRYPQTEFIETTNVCFDEALQEAAPRRANAYLPGKTEKVSVSFSRAGSQVPVIFYRI